MSIPIKPIRTTPTLRQLQMAFQNVVTDICNQYPARPSIETQSTLYNLESEIIGHETRYLTKIITKLNTSKIMKTAHYKLARQFRSLSPDQQNELNNTERLLQACQFIMNGSKLRQSIIILSCPYPTASTQKETDTTSEKAYQLTGTSHLDHSQNYG